MWCSDGGLWSSGCDADLQVMASLVTGDRCVWRRNTGLVGYVFFVYSGNAGEREVPVAAPGLLVFAGRRCRWWL